MDMASSRICCGLLTLHITANLLFFQNLPTLGQRPRILGRHPLKGAGERQPLSPDFAYLPHNPENHRRQGPIRRGMVMLTRAMLQGWPPESGHIGGHHAIALIAMHLPIGDGLDISLPPAQEDGRPPHPTPESRPGPPHGDVRKPDGFKGGEERAAFW